MKNKITSGNIRTKKSGYSGNELWQAHRLEPDVRDFGAKSIKKKKVNDRKKV